MAKGFKNITGVKASSIAMFEGTFAFALGLVIAILRSLETTVKIADSTNSVLTGLAFGITAGIVSIIVVPFIYFGIGWVVGYIHGWVFNLIVANSGGIGVKIDE